MASVPILDWRPEVDKYVKGVNTTNYLTLLDDEIKEVLRDFCEVTHLLTQTIDPFIDVVADQAAYALYPLIDDTDGTLDIEIVESVQYKPDGDDNDQFRSLWPFTDWVQDATGVNQPNGLAGDWRYLTSPQPTNFWVEADKTLNLYQIPSVKSDAGLRVTLVLKPDDDATAIVEWMWQDWKKAIAWGAASRIMGMTTQKWFNRDLSDYFWVRYLDRRSNAALKKTTGFTRRDLHVQIPSYGGARSRSWVF